MKVLSRFMGDGLLLEPRVHEDGRGWFYESWNERDFRELVPQAGVFTQDNHSRSAHGVLRGLHYQETKPQGKLVRVTVGEIFDVVVDLREDSTAFGKWVGFKLSAENKRILWVPPGFAHGFLTLDNETEVQYKTTDYYAPDDQRTIAWNDADIGVSWPIAGEPILSSADQAGRRLRELFPEHFRAKTA